MKKKDGSMKLFKIYENSIKINMNLLKFSHSHEEHAMKHKHIVRSTRNVSLQ